MKWLYWSICTQDILLWTGTQFYYRYRKSQTDFFVKRANVRNTLVLFLREKYTRAPISRKHIWFLAGLFVASASTDNEGRFTDLTYRCPPTARSQHTVHPVAASGTGRAHSQVIKAAAQISAPGLAAARACLAVVPNLDTSTCVLHARDTCLSVPEMPQMPSHSSKEGFIPDKFLPFRRTVPAHYTLLREIAAH